MAAVVAPRPGWKQNILLHLHAGVCAYMYALSCYEWHVYCTHIWYSGCLGLLQNSCFPSPAVQSPRSQPRMGVSYTPSSVNCVWCFVPVSSQLCLLPLLVDFCTQRCSFEEYISKGVQYFFGLAVLPGFHYQLHFLNSFPALSVDLWLCRGSVRPSEGQFHMYIHVHCMHASCH